MKKFIMMVAVMAAAVTANAQVYIGGGISYDHERASYQDVENAVKPEATNSFKIMPEVGYKINDNMAVGIELGYTYSKGGSMEVLGTTYENVKTNAFGVSPYFRYTFAKWGKVGFFCQAQFDYAYSKSKADNADGTKAEYTTNTWGIGVRPGISIDITDHFTFLTKIGYLGYQSSKPNAKNGNNEAKYKASSDFGFNLSGQNIIFALNYTF